MIDIRPAKFLFNFLFFLQAARLFYIYFFYNNFIEEKKKNQYIVYTTDLVLRAEFIDINGNCLSKNKPSISVCCSPANYKNYSDEFLNYLKKNYSEILKKIYSNKNKYFFYIKRKISNEEAEFFKENFPADVFFVKEYERVYPYNFLSPVIGQVDIDTNGISGLEFSLEKKVRGKKIINKKNFFDLDSSVILTEKEPVKLTIDSILSYKIFSLIKEAKEKYQSEYITAIVMNPENGDLISVVQYPFNDPIINDQKMLKFEKPFSITEAYEMGSIFKAFCMLAAIDEKVVEKDELIDCRNTKSTFIKKLPVNTWKEHGIIPFWQVIQESNNIGIVQVAMHLDKKLYDHYSKLGFGKKLGIEIPGEATGYITPKNKWSGQTILSLSYGYEVSTSLLQLISAWSIFSENGIKTFPRILLSSPIRKSEKLYDENSIKIAKEIIEYDETRIPKKDLKYFKDYKIYGKTGTANILENGFYNKNKNTYVFVGHIEKNNFKRIIGVYVRLSNKSDVYASTIAQPLFFEIAKKIVIN